MIGFREIAGNDRRTFRELAGARNVSSFRQLVEAHGVEQEFDRWWGENRALLTVGKPVGGVVRSDDGGYQRTHNFGVLIKPQDRGIDVKTRTVVNVEIAGVRCFATDDPSGTDEIYLITTLYAVDPLQKERAVTVKRIGPQDFSNGDVFFQGSRLDDEGFWIAGDAGVRIHVAIWDEEMGGRQRIEEDYKNAAKQGIRAGLTYLAGPAGVGAGEALGATEAAAQKVGELVADIIGDDLIGQHQFPVDSDFLTRSKDGQIPDLRSNSIPGETYNFPEGPEETRYLFSRGSGQGAYRVFFRIRTQRKDV